MNRSQPHHPASTRASKDGVELVPSNPWIARLLAAIATVLIGTGGWLCLRARSKPRPAVTTQAVAEPTPVASNDYTIEAPSWGIASPAAPSRPVREPDERERAAQAFAAKANEQWQGVEIFVRKR